MIVLRRLDAKPLLRWGFELRLGRLLLGLARANERGMVFVFGARWRSRWS